jgi:hypothetical protein
MRRRTPSTEPPSSSCSSAPSSAPTSSPTRTSSTRPSNPSPTSSVTAGRPLNGDFAMTPDELDDVLAALRGADIAVQATHQYMLTDDPRLIYSHFWAIGDAAELAEGLRAALDHTDNAVESNG